MKLQKIEITPEQIISLNHAIYLLEQSNPKKVICLQHLKQLAATASKAKIIKGDNNE